MSSTARKSVHFTSCQDLTQRLVLATLTGRSIQISQIRPESISNPGLAPHEISFLRLLEAITNGSVIDISMTGTTLRYKPGLIIGNAPGAGAISGVIRHELPAACERGMSYFLVPLCLLAPFSKARINVLFTGPGVITSSTTMGDMSVDSVRTSILPLYAQFGIQNDLELRILRRSNPGPRGIGGAGEVQLVFGHQVRLPKTLHLLNAGRIKKIRGVAYSTGVAASNNARMIETVRGILNPLTPDTYIFSDVSSAPYIPSSDSSAPKKKIGLGFGLSLVAESSTGCLYSADMASSSEGGQTPEDVGEQCAHQLLQILSMSGTIPITAATTVLTLMAMGSEDVGRLKIGKDVLASEIVIGLARDLAEFGSGRWGIRDTPDEEDDGVLVSVVGGGVGNIGRKLG